MKKQSEDSTLKNVGNLFKSKNKIKQSQTE